MPTKLTDTQLTTLIRAAERKDRLLEVSSNLKGAAAEKVSTKLVALSLVNEISAKPGSPVWRRDAATSKSYALKLTAAGAKAMVIDKAAEAGSGDEGDPTREQANPGASREVSRTGRASSSAGTGPNAAVNVTPERNAPRDGTKLALVINLLQRDEGATLAQLVAATD